MKGRIAASWRTSCVSSGISLVCLFRSTSVRSKSVTYSIYIWAVRLKKWMAHIVYYIWCMLAVVVILFA